VTASIQNLDVAFDKFDFTRLPVSRIDRLRREQDKKQSKVRPRAKETN
jgi:hypothetical protein